LYIYNTPEIEELIKENIYLFMKTSSIYEYTPFLTFESAGQFINSGEADLVPLVFLINGERVETLWGFDNGIWKILEIDVHWKDSIFYIPQEENVLLTKTVKFTSGFRLDDPIEKYQTEDWALEIGLELDYFDFFGIDIDFGFNNIVDDENIMMKAYEFESKIRARLNYTLNLDQRDLSLSAFIKAGVGLKLHFSNWVEEDALTGETIGIKDYYSFPTIFTAGIEYSNTALTPQLAAGIELEYKIETPYSSFLVAVEEDSDLSYVSFTPSLYVKWVY
jgi:hypothetical protein